MGETAAAGQAAGAEAAANAAKTGAAGANVESKADGEGSRSKAWEAAEAFKKEATELRQWRAEREAKDAAAEKDRLAKNGEHEKLTTLAQKEAADAKAETAKLRLTTALLQGALKHDLKPNRIAMVDSSKITFAADGTPSGVDEAFASLKAADPSVFGSGVVADVKTKDTTTSRGTAGGETFDPKKVITVDDERKLTPEQRKAFIAYAMPERAGTMDPLTGRRS